ncbi:MAG: bacteriophage abortive infection AbiH family protein [Bacteroides sp.]
MKNLYIIGNGFDKHHKIPSGYRDFHGWLNDKNPELVEQIDELYGYSDDLWGNFEVELGNLDIPSVASEIYADNQADELSEHYERSFHAGAIVAGDTVGEIYNKIREMFPAWVKSLPAADTCKKIKIDKEDSFFITFNYTDTLLDVYGIPLDDILFIHGRASDSANRHLVLGHGKSREEIQREAEAKFDEETHPAFIQTVEAVERQVNMMKKNTSRIIDDNQSTWEAMKDVQHIYCYGLSMSPVDMPYLQKIVASIDSKHVIWHANVFGNDDREIEAQKVEKKKILLSLGINEELIEFCTLDEIQAVKQEALF